MEEYLSRVIVFGPVILFSLTIHEFSHAWSAHKFGDDTAKNMGRMSLNPIVHLDMMGLMVMVISQFTFGWAKPVPVNLMNVKNPRMADIWVSAAGPLSNFAIAIIAGIFYQLLIDEYTNPFFEQFLYAAVIINVTLAFFNLVPLFPLDGSHILRNLVPRDIGIKIESFNKYAPMVLIFLVFTRTLWVFLGPPVVFVVYLLLGR